MFLTGFHFLEATTSPLQDENEAEMLKLAIAMSLEEGQENIACGAGYQRKYLVKIREAQKVPKKNQIARRGYLDKEFANTFKSKNANLCPGATHETPQDEDDEEEMLKIAIAMSMEEHK